MDTLIVSVKNETQKLFLKKKTLALLIASAVITLLAVFLALFFQNSFGIIPINGSSFPVWVLGYFTSLFIPLFVFMIASDLFAGELGEKTLKLVLLHPITRLKVFISKIITIAVYIIVNLGIVFIVSSLGSMFINGKHDFAMSFIKGFEAYSFSVLPMLLLGIITAFISQFFKSSSGALTISILVFIGTKIVAIVFPGISSVLYTTYTDWNMLIVGSAVSIGKVFNVFMFMVSYSIIFLGSGYLMFERREL